MVKMSFLLHKSHFSEDLFWFWSNRPLALGTVYSASNCTDFSNFIFAIKQGGLEKTLEVYNSLIAQLA